MPIDYEQGKLQKVSYGGTARWEEITEPNPSGVIVFSRESRNITRYFLVALADIADFFDDCFDGGIAPKRHPAEFFKYLYIDTVTMAPFDKSQLLETDEGMLEPEYYLVTVTYSPLDQNSEGSGPTEVFSGSMNFSMEGISLPGRALSFADAATVPIDDELNYTLQIPIVERSILVTRATDYNIAAIRANIGCVNDGTFDGASSETNLYSGASVRWKFDSQGRRSFDIEHHFKERVIRWGASNYGWNHHFDKKSGNWRKVVYYRPDTSSVVTPYKLSASFADLITV